MKQKLFLLNTFNFYLKKHSSMLDLFFMLVYNMLQVFHSNYHPFIIDETAPLSFTLVDSTSDRKKHYYRINESQVTIIERMNKFVLALLKTIFSAGFALRSIQVRSLWREALWSKREAVLIAPANSRIQLPTQLNQNDIQESNEKYTREIEEIKEWLLSLGFTHKINAFPDLTSISISEKDLENIPENIGLLESLQWLDFCQNQLETIPDSVRQLTNLKFLNLAWNKLQNIPESIFLLKELEVLHLSKNPFRVIPDEVSQLLNIKQFYCHGCQIQNVPDAISQLDKLESLHLSENLLQMFPASMANLFNLKYLHLARNRFQVFPETLIQLKNLVFLDLGFNQLQSIPERIDQLTALENLSLYNNRFESIPECLYDLPETCTVDLQSNPLSHDTIEQAIARTQAANYRGPQFLFSIDD